jgi:hypothetical protein
MRGFAPTWFARPRGESASKIVPGFVVGLVAFVVRIFPIATSGGFPLNDGGLFYVMARDLQSNSFVMPATTSYNGGQIPFVYPPLGLYLVAVLHAVLPVRLLDLFIWLPFILSIASVAAVFFLARELLPSRFHALVATAAFAVTPVSYLWVVVGGGVTRGLGLVLGLLAVAWTVKFLRRGRRRDCAAAILAGGLAIMSHPNAALFTVVAIALFGLQARSIRRTALVAFGVAAVSAVWWMPVVIRFGPARLVSAGSLDGPLIGLLEGFYGLLSFATTQEVFLPFVAAAGLLGMLLLLHRRSGFLFAWMAVELLIDQRVGAMYALVPLSLAASYGVADVILPAFVRVTEYGDGLVPEEIRRSGAVRNGLLAVLCLAMLGGMAFDVSPASLEHAVPAATRDAYQWVADHTPADARFVVITGGPGGNEGNQEWFPALTSRISETTPQGVEWLGAEKWRDVSNDNVALQKCASDTADCLITWAAARGHAPDYVFLPKGQLLGPLSPSDCCTTLRKSLLASADFAVVYDGPGATIARWVSRP